MDFIVINDRAEKLATLTPDCELPKPVFTSGQATLYGEIVCIDEVDAKVEAKLISGITIYCHYEVSLASHLGSLLHNTVGLEGKARWNSRTFEIAEFLVTGIVPYEATSLGESFESLKWIKKFKHENEHNYRGEECF